MAKVRIEAGAEFDAVSSREMDAYTSKVTDKMDSFIREWNRGLKFMRTVADAQGQTQFDVDGPQQGYVWSLRLVSITQTTGSTALLVYLGSSLRNLIGSGSSGSHQVVTWGKGQVIVYPGEKITITTNNNTGIIGAYSVNAIEAPAEMIGKLL